MLMKGSLIKDTYEGKEITVYIPPSCGAWNMTFPLLFVQDGDYLFESNVEQLEAKFANGDLPELIVAGVAPHNRLDEYTPWPAGALVDSRPGFGGRADEYIRFLIDRLKPYLEANYYAQSGRGQTGVLGASLGGLLALYAGCRRPDAFTRYGLLSASMWYEGMLSFIHRESARLAAGDSRLYVSVGSLEGVGKETVQKDMVPFTMQAVQMLRQSGFGPERLRFDVVDGGIHEHNWFVNQFSRAVEWLYGGEKAR